MKIWSAVIVALLAGLCMACVEPVVGRAISDDVVTRVVNLSDFTSVHVSDAFQVDIKQSEQHELVVYVDRDLLEDLIVEKKGATVEIGLDPRRLTSRNVNTLRAEISLPLLLELELSGACRANLHGLKNAGSLGVSTSGASEVSGQLESKSVRFTVSGASELDLSGSAQTMTLDASGASDVDLRSFVVSDADAGVSGASEALIFVKDHLSASASGSSSLRYKGNPEIKRMHSSGGSSIQRWP